MEINEKMEKIFSDRLYELSLLKNISEEQLVAKFSKVFPREFLEKSFSGEEMPTDVLVAGLAKFFNVSADAFFEPGERISDVNLLKLREKDIKIRHLEKLLDKKIDYSAKNYFAVLRDNVQEALDKGLVTRYVRKAHSFRCGMDSTFISEME